MWNTIGEIWPGQPKCFQCTSGSSDTDCFLDITTAPTMCTNYYDSSCMIKQTGISLKSNWAQKSMNDVAAKQSLGSKRSISRGCGAYTSTNTAPADMSTMMSTRDSAQDQIYYEDKEWHCYTDGCNFGP